MAVLTKEQLEGFVPAVVSPFNERGDLMEDAFVEIVRWLVSNGATGICIAGDNGESWALTPEERVRLTKLAVTCVAGKMPVIMGATAPGTAQTIRYAQAARDAGAAAVLVMPSTYVLKASRDELLRRYEALAKAVDIPIVAYNSPRRTGGIEMSVADIEAITNVAPIIGIKESHRDFFHHTHLLERLRERISILVGPCHYIIPGIALGAKGFIATGPELIGPMAGRLTSLAKTAPGPEHAMWHYRLTAIYQALMGIGTWPAALKAAINLLGQPAGVPRDPVMPLDGAATEKLRRTMSELGLLKT